MDELLALRALVADAPDEDPAARLEVWSRFAARRRSRRPLVLALAAATVATAALALALRGSIAVDTADAACVKAGGSTSACLQALADAARAGGAPPRIAYQRLIAYSLPSVQHVPEGTFSVRAAQTVERWTERDGPHGAERTSPARLSFPAEVDRARWARAGSPSWRELTHKQLAAASVRRVADSNAITGCNQRRQARSVSTDPAAVRQQLREIAARHHHTDWATFYYAFCLPNPFLTGAQRAALLEALAPVRSIHLTGRIRDPLGRPGVGLRSTIKGETLVTVYDPTTGRILASGLRLRSQLGGRFFWTAAFLVEAAPAKALLVRPG
jgi:hypothetical protein